MSDPTFPVAFRTLGCKVNRVESEDIAADLLGKGARVTGEDDALVIVVNTCTVTGEADAKARKAIRQALKARRSPLVVVTGCLAALDREVVEALGDRVVVEADKERVAQRVAEALGLEGGGHGVEVGRVGEEFRTRALLKIEDGCDVFCAYCIVPHARGVPRSVPLAEAVARAEKLVAQGASEIVLTGINIGRYRDTNSDADLADLVEAVGGTGIARLRLSSIEPPDVGPRLLEAFASTSAGVPHLHVPLQSGSNEVLSAMRRTYTAEQYADTLAAARDAIPGLAVTTDIIAGFPGETDQQAAESMRFIESQGFAKLHVFRYSERPGTPAAAMKQVAPQVRAERADALRRLGEAQRAAFIASRLGTTAPVLVERVETGSAQGTTGDYLRVEFEPLAPVVPGELVAVSLESAHGERVKGRMMMHAE